MEKCGSFYGTVEEKISDMDLCCVKEGHDLPHKRVDGLEFLVMDPRIVRGRDGIDYVGAIPVDQIPEPVEYS